jgi:hypothetical protein
MDQRGGSPETILHRADVLYDILNCSLGQEDWALLSLSA